MVPLRLPHGVVIDEVDAEDRPGVFVVLDPEKPSWAFVNQIGVETLRLCDGTRTVEEISGILAQRDPALDRSAVLQQVESFLDRMEGNQLLGRSLQEAPKPENVFSSLALEITAECNLRCAHCYLAAGDPHAGELSFEEVCRVLDESKLAGGVSVAIGGGEPLLREDCGAIVEYALSQDLMVSLGTNGTLIDDSVMAWLASAPVKIQISLDGARAEVHDRIRGKGNFALSMAGLRRLLDAGRAPDIVIAFTPMVPNFEDVPAIIDLALEFGIPVVQFPPLSLSGRARQNASRLFLSDDQILQCWRWISERSDALRGRMDLLADCFSMNINRPGNPIRCTIGTQIRVDPSGDAYPCQCFHSGDEFRLGNLRETSLTAMVTGEKLAEIKRTSFQRRDRITECRACRLRNFCGGGCMGKAFDHHGTVYRPIDCGLRKRWIEGLFEARYPGPNGPRPSPPRQ